MYIQKIEGWTCVGHLESDVYVPYNEQVPEDFEIIWFVENVHPSVDKLFTSFTLPINKDNNITLENLRNTKYIKLQYDIFDYPFYGWVDGTTPISRNHMAVVWHPDYWRTYFRKCQYKGWVKLRAPIGKDPYHIIPAFYQHGTLEDIDIVNQLKGVAWVTITFIESDFVIKKVLSAVGGAGAIDGIQHFFTRLGSMICNVFAPGLINYFNRANEAGPNEERIRQGMANDSQSFTFMRDFDVVRCLTFPISLIATERVNFVTSDILKIEGRFRPHSNPFTGPTMYEVTNGALGKQLGIEENKLISCVVSPVCPFKLLGTRVDKGKTPDNPIKIKGMSEHIKVKHFNSSAWKIITTESINNRGFARIKGFGLRDLGDIKNGCRYLFDILNRYYLGYYPLDEIKYGGYTVTIKTSDKLRTRDGRLLMKFTQYMDLLYPMWRTCALIDIKGLLYPSIELRYKSLLYVITYDGDVPIEPWQPTRVSPTKIIWDISYTQEQIDSMVEVSDWLRSTIPDPGDPDGIQIVNDYVEIITNKNKTKSILIDGIFIAVTDSDQESWPQHFTFTKDIDVSLYSPASMERVGFFNSTNDFGQVCGIYNRSLIFSKIRGSLPRELYTDDYKDLYLIGPNGEIIYKFQTGVKIKGYTYQLVIDQAPFLKFKFDIEEGMTRYTQVSDAEVHVPLTPMTAFTSYSNPWRYVSESAQQVMKHRFENQDVARARNIKAKNIVLERDKEQAGLTNNMGILINKGLSWVGEKIVNGLQNLGGIFGLLGGSRGGDGGRTGTMALKFAIEQGNTDKSGFGHIVGGLENLLKHGPLFPDVTSFYKRETNVLLDTFKREDKERSFRQQIGGFQLDDSISTMLSIGDASWLGDFGGLRLVYVTKDDYSINRYHDTANVIGIEVNEHVPEFTDIEPGPLKLEPCILQGEDVPQEAIAYIKSRLEAGVYVDKDL